MKKPNPSAFLHVMHMDLGQKHRVPELTDTNPFGCPGRDYDPSYTVTCDPLYTTGQLVELVQALEPIVTPFIELPYGTKFIHEPGAPDVWVRTGHNLIAEWGTSARTQSLCCFSHEEDGLSQCVWVVDGSQDAKAKTPGAEALASSVGTVVGYQCVNKVHHYPTVAWRAEVPVGTELFIRPQQSAEVETLAELALARRYLEQALAALNPRAQLATNIRKLLGL